MSDDDGLKAMGQVIQIDEARIRDHLGEMVRGTVEETLNALLDAEADRLCGAGRYERSQGRQDRASCLRASADGGSWLRAASGSPAPTVLWQSAPTRADNATGGPAQSSDRSAPQRRGPHWLR